MNATVVSIGLALLKLAAVFLELAKAKQLLDAGAYRSIAQASASILKDTEYSKIIMDQWSGMNETQVDDTLKELEPK